MDAKNYREKRQQIHKLRKRNEDLAANATGLSRSNDDMEVRIAAIEKEVARFRSINIELAHRVEEEVLRQKENRESLESIAKEVAQLELLYEHHREKFLSCASEADKLERELEKLNAKKAAYLKYSKRAQGNLAALDIRKNSIKNAMVKGHNELKVLEGGKVSASEKRALQERVRRMSGADKKAGSVIYTCLREIIGNMESNEFEGLSYRTRIDKSKNKMGARVFFQNVTTHYNDLREMLKPVIDDLGNRFRSRQVEITTKAKKNSAGVVSAVDVTVVVMIQPEARRSANLLE